MTFKNVDYLIVVNYFSKFSEIIVLPDKIAKTDVEHLKCVFARFGVPDEIMFDNTPFQIQEFLTFSRVGF